MDDRDNRQMDVSFAVLAEQVRSLSSQVTKLEAKLDYVAVQVSEATNRWKGGLAIILAAGGLVGFAISVWKGFMR